MNYGYARHGHSLGERTLALDKLVTMAKLLGLRVQYDPSLDIWYENNTIYLSYITEERVAHEIAHWLLAAKWRKGATNYGFSGEVSERYGNEEEKGAAILGMLLQFHCDGKPDYYVQEYPWNVPGRDEVDTDYIFWEGAQYLLERGWIDGEFRLVKDKILKEKFR